MEELCSVDETVGGTSSEDIAVSVSTEVCEVKDSVNGERGQSTAGPPKVHKVCALEGGWLGGGNLNEHGISEQWVPVRPPD